MSNLIEEPLPKGTKEHLIVDVTDRLKSLTDLSSTAPKFDVRLKDTTDWVVQNIVAQAIGMRLFCLVDTTSYVVGRYELFVHFDNLPESPRLGPIDFYVNA